MSDTNLLFDNAELALAAYADLEAGLSTDSQTPALEAAGMSTKQALEFAARWPEN